MNIAKKEAGVVIVFVLVVFLVSSIVGAFWPFDGDDRDVRLQPQQSTDVSVTVNSAPTVTSITVDGDESPLDFDLPDENVILTSGGTKQVNVRIVVDDVDNNLDDTSVTVQFTKTGENDRPAVAASCDCVAGCGNAPSTYECSTANPPAIDMEYYDDDGTWTVTITVIDLLGASPSSGLSDTFNVDLLSSITLGTGSPIEFGVVSSPDADVPATADTQIINNGNYDTTGGGTGNGYVQIKAYDLHGNTVTTELIAASSFEAGDGDGSLDCLPGPPTATQLGPEGNAVDIVNLDLPKGDGTGGNNIGEFETCLRTVPGSLTSQTFSARNDHPECISSGGTVACAWEVILP